MTALHFGRGGRFTKTEGGLPTPPRRWRNASPDEKRAQDCADCVPLHPALWPRLRIAASLMRAGGFPRFRDAFHAGFSPSQTRGSDHARARMADTHVCEVAAASR